MIKKIHVSPINNFVTGENGSFLKAIAQDVPRNAYYLRLLSLGDIEEVKKTRKPSLTTKPKEAAE